MDLFTSGNEYLRKTKTLEAKSAAPDSAVTCQPPERQKYGACIEKALIAAAQTQWSVLINHWTTIFGK